MNDWINDIKLVPATLDEYPKIQNMGRFYVYDMSKYMGADKEWEIPEDGLFECIDFKKYWETREAYPFIIRIDDEIAGFVIVDKKGSDEGVDFNMAQFFILRKFQGMGVGRAVARQCFDLYHGVWEVMVMPKNEGAYLFWKRVIGEYTKNNFTEYTRNVKIIGYTEKNIFRFKSN